MAAIARATKREWPDQWLMKVHGGPMQMVGVPDMLFCIDGHFIGLEVKFQRPGESRVHARHKATPSQRVQLRKIAAAGGTAGVVLTAPEALGLIRRGLRNVRETRER